jgi:hypothetical protein
MCYNHLMWWEEITVSLGSLKMVSEGTESIRVENRMRFGIHYVVHKVWLIYSEVRHEVAHPHKTETEFKFPTLSSAHLLPAQNMQKTHEIKISWVLKCPPSHW